MTHSFCMVECVRWEAAQVLTGIAVPILTTAKFFSNEHANSEVLSGSLFRLTLFLPKR